jgi:hypothetical protein
MLNASMLRAYRAERAKGYGAKVSLQIVKSNERFKDMFDWQDAGGSGDVFKKVRWSEQGFNLYATMAYDTDADFALEGLGEFTDHHDAGAMKHSDGGREYKWFVPSYSLAERYADARKAGYAKEPARLKALEGIERDYRRARRYGDDWSSVGIRVRVYKDGIELADESVWGFEYEYPYTYANEATREVADEALWAAKKDLLEKIQESMRNLRVLHETKLAVGV